MSEQTEQPFPQHSPCPACGGTGQLNFFKGESRFLLSVEECPACCGFGYVEEERDESEGKGEKFEEAGDRG